MQPTTAPLKILVARPDRIGDVVLSTPVLELLKRNYPNCHLTFLVQESVAPLVRGLSSVDDVLIYEPQGRHAGINGLFALIEDFRQREFKIGVVLHSHWKIAAALFAAGVRYRVGPLSKPHSFLFYNRGARQRRSLVEMHEADYNLQLLRRLGIRVPSREIPVRVAQSPEARAWALDWLSSQGYQPATGERLVIVHPGMGGSALNWPENHYVELMRALLRDGRRVLVSAGPGEAALLDRIKAELGELAERTIFYGGTDVQGVDRLAALFSFGACVVAPSTGPLHVAVAVGTPVVSFYPPIRVQSALRWGPYLSDEPRASVLVPDVFCGEDFDCRGTLCNYYPCMRGLMPQQALEQVEKHLNATEDKKS